MTLGIALERAGVRCRYVPLNGLTEIVWPPICGIQRMYIEQAQTPGEKRFAIRHGFAHVLDGHVADLAYSHDGHNPMGYEERVADLFAFVDLIPARKLMEMKQSGYRPWDIELWMAQEMMRFCPTWKRPRLHDRLNMLLPLPEVAR